MRSIRVLFGVLVGVLAVLVLAGSAQAAIGFGGTGAFAQAANDGSGVPETHHRRIAVDRATGDVYVTDTVNDRIAVYRPNATSADLLTTFGSGDLSDPFGVAIDQSTGAVYVSDSANSRVQRFASDGASTPTFTLDGTFASPGNASALAFDQSAGELVYIDPSVGQVKRADTTGAPVGAGFDGSSTGSAFTSLQDLAVTSTGEVVVVDSTGNPAEGSEGRVERFAANGDHNGSIGPVSVVATVAVIGDGDRIAVSGAQDNVNTVAYATISVFTNDGVLESTVSSGEQYSIVTGIAADDGVGGRLYLASDASPLYSYTYGGSSIQALEPYTLPTVTTPAVSAVTPHEAHLTGMVNPQGSSTSYRFEVSTDGGDSWTQVDPDTDGDEDAGDGSTDVTVEADLTGLDPATTYKVRLLATKNSATVATSPQAQFTTGLVVPTVESPAHAPDQPYETEAYLNALINPNRAPATIHFEYGTTTSYGQTTNTQTLAAGSTLVNVTARIRGLTPGTRYHFRAIATNDAGQTTGPDQTFTTQTPTSADTCTNKTIRAQQRATSLADCRAYEQVSPPNKAGIAVNERFTVQSTPAGDAVAYAANGAFPGAATSMLGSYYISRRSNTDWSTDPIDPPQTNAISQMSLPSLFLTSDLSSTMQYSSRALAGGIEGGGNLYLRNNLTGTRTLAASTSSFHMEQELTNASGTQPVGASADLSHFAFSTTAGGLVPEIADDGQYQAYETVNGRVRLVSYLPDGSIPSGGAVVGVDYGADRQGPPLKHPVSADGRRIFFESPPGPSGALYVRIDGTTTLPISLSRRTGGPSGPRSARFLGASENGDVVYFMSDEWLTDDDSGGIYRYHLDTNVLDHLTPTRNDPNDSGALIWSTPAISADGSTVYFVSEANLVEGRSERGIRVYVVRNGEVSYVAPYNEARMNAFASRDGRFFVFSSASSATGYDNENQACKASDYGSLRDVMCSEVFRYDAETKKLRCLSCLSNAVENRHSHVWFQQRSISGYASRTVLNDGRVYFSSSESLVPGDVNGRQDVYEWRDGAPRLISDGRTAADATFVEASADGRDVFFTTTARLVASDTDDEMDIYDARQGGGLSGQNDVARTTAPCSDDGCQGMPATRPGLESTGSTAVAGEGGARSPARPRVFGARTVRGISARLRVRVPGRGRIRTSGSGLSQSSTTTGKAGTYPITVRLSRRSRQTLKRKHRVKVRVVVRFTPSGGQARSVRVSLTFKAAAASKRKGRS